MATPRRSREQKTPKDRETYYANTIAQKDEPSPTLERPLSTGDPTNRMLDSPIEPTYNTQPTIPNNWFAKFWREHGALTIVSSVVIGLLAYLALQVYSLNREIGELKMQLNETRTLQDRSEKELEKTEARLKSAIDKTDEKLEQISGQRK